MAVCDEISKAYTGRGPIPRERVLGWIERGDLEAWGLLYTLTRDAHDRIEPKLDLQTAGEFLLDYYLRCIAEDPEPNDDLHSRFEAAWEMVPWLDHLWELKPESERLLALFVERVTESYRHGATEVRNAIETGFLEHAFERKELVALFAEWRHDPELGHAYELCLDWGRAHPRK